MNFWIYMATGIAFQILLNFLWRFIKQKIEEKKRKKNLEKLASFLIIITWRLLLKKINDEKKGGEKWLKNEIIEPKKKTIKEKIINTVFWILMTPALIMLAGAIERTKNENKRSKKYRKVIKEGLFYDSIEWHERE